MAKPYRDMNVIGVFSLLLATMFTIEMFAAQFVRLPVSELILVEQRGLYPMESTMLAKVGYGVVLAVLGLASVCSILGAPRPFLTDRRASGLLRPLLALVPVLAVFLCAPVSLPFLCGVCVALGGWLYIRRRPPSASRWARAVASICLSPLLTLGTVFYLGLTMLMPLSLPLVASDGAQLVSMQNHYAGFLPGMDLVAGDSAFPIGVLNYGLGPALVVAATQRFLQVIGCSPLDLVQVVKVAQFLPLVLIVLCAFRFKPRNRVALFTLALVVTPSLSLLATGMFYPNLLGLRFVPFFIVALLMLSMTAARGPMPVIAAGAVAALLAVFAAETGLVSSGALFVFCALREFKSRSRGLSLIRCMALFAGGFGFLFLLSSIITRGISNAPTEAFVSSLPYIFASDFGGILASPLPLAVGVVFIASCSVFGAFVRAGRGNLKRWDPYQAGIGVLMLGWLLYYVNRVHELNLYAQGGLLILLIAPRFSAATVRVLSLGSACGRGYVGIVAALLFGMIADRLVATVVEADDALFRARVTAPIEGARTSMQVSSTYERGIEDQLRALSARRPEKDYLVLSHLSVEVRLLGFNEGFPWYDAFSDILTAPALERVSAWIDTNGPCYLLVDDPLSRLSLDAPYQTAQIQRLVGVLKAYRKESVGNGWVLYVRNP